jgi:hypothetical protein
MFELDHREDGDTPEGTRGAARFPLGEGPPDEGDEPCRCDWLGADTRCDWLGADCRCDWPGTE